MTQQEYQPEVRPCPQRRLDESTASAQRYYCQRSFGPTQRSGPITRTTLQHYMGTSAAGIRK